MHIAERGHAVQLEEARLKAEEDDCCSVDCVADLRSLRHLDQVVALHTSSIVVVAFYSRVSKLSSEGMRSSRSGATASLSAHMPLSWALWHALPLRLRCDCSA